MYKMLSALCVASLSSCAAMPAMAQEYAPGCGEFSAVRELLSDQYGEFPLTAGVSTDGVVTEMWTNRQTGTWTVLQTYPNMVTCIVDDGDMFIAVPQQPDV